MLVPPVLAGRHAPTFRRSSPAETFTVPAAARYRPILAAALFLGIGHVWAVPTPRPAAPIYPAIEGLSEIRSVHVTAEGATLHALLAGVFGTRPEAAVAYVNSRDHGRHWSRPVWLTQPKDRPVISKRGNDVVLTARSKRLAAVWQQQADIPGTGPLAVAYSRDGGGHWSRGENPAPGDITDNQSHPDLASDTAGNVHLVWLDDREENGNTQGLRYARSIDGGHHWQQETTVDPAICTCCWNRLVALPDRSVLALYRNSGPHDMALAEREAQSGAWRGLGAVGAFDWQFTGCPHCGGGLAVASRTAREHGLHSVVWTGKEGAQGLYYLGSSNRGQTWSQPLPIADGHARESDIAANPQGIAIVYSAPNRDGGAPIRFRWSGDAGKTWSEPGMLSGPSVEADHPRVVATNRRMLAYWTEASHRGGKRWAIAYLQ